AVWTARITLAIPSALFIVVTLMLIGTLERLGSRLLPKDDFYAPLFPWRFVTNYNQIRFSGAEFVHQLIITAASPALVVILVGILLSVLVAVWSLIPSAWSEISPPKSDDRISNQFGEWLTNGIQLIDTWGNVFVIIMALVFPITYLVCFLYPQITPQSNLTEEIIGIFATVLVTSTTSLLAFRGRLDWLSLGFRNALDIILDVDNYLRVHPLDSNPRARICARYVSVLRYLCNWKDPQDGQGYDAILIVAHSQGTVITADLLRFLKRETDLALQRIVSDELPIYFFTMGCPLRQLYGLSFPHLYNWARHYGKPNSDKECNSVAQEEWIPGNPPYIPNNQKPDPSKLLGVRRWVNTFRSADYVGRYLWRSDACSYQWLKPAERKDQDTSWTSDRDRPVNFSEDKNRTRQEFCLGAGAHTHYWNGTSDEVAAEIDLLIQEAYRETRKKQISSRR
ncbi:MAG: hypothetical protein F6K28_19075, partial [Microcoleus sp. SIO2G3]|nr:hypothetical protein [Microcoleus sp. SIO2G3]